MKRYLALLLAFVMVLSFTGCEKTTRNGGEGGTTNPASEPAESKVETTAAPTEEETKTEAEPVDDGPADEPYESDEVEVLSLKRGTMSTYNWNDEYETILIYASYPFVYLDGDSETEYAALNDSLNQYNEKLREKDYAEYAACLGDALYMIEEEPESFLSFNIKKNAKVRRADSNVLSILYEDDSYVGIRRSEHFFSGVTFDSKTGKQLELSDVVTDMSKVPALVKEQLQTFYDADRLEYAVDIESGNTGELTAYLQSIVDHGDGSAEDIEKAKELIAKLAEYKPLAKVEEREEQNYNMIDNVLNNLPQDPEEKKEPAPQKEMRVSEVKKVRKRVSMKALLAEKKAEVAEREKKPPEVNAPSKRPSMGVDD